MPCFKFVLDLSYSSLLVSLLSWKAVAINGLSRILKKKLILAAVYKIWDSNAKLNLFSKF